MSDLQINIKQIRNKFIQVIIYEFPLILLFNWLESWSESLPKAINALIILLAFLMFFYGYKLCCQVADNYAQYKGYKNHFYVYSILNIFGLLILFLLKNRNLSKKRIDKERLLNFSISSILISWFIIIPFVLILPGILIVFYIASLEGYAKYVSNYEDLLSIVTIPMDIMCIWYFIRELKRVNINHKFILGSLRKIDFKLPIGLTIITYLFDCGINPITLYGLSFVVPQYVENQINGQDSTTTLGWICYAIITLFFAPLMEELLFRGIILQKLATQKNIIQGLMISAIAFALMHLRFDIISLFIMGIILALVYLKTKQLAVSIIFHFSYNLIVLARDLYYQFFSGVDPFIKITIAEYQQQFLDNWKLDILFVALSTPYLCYFIYKNFPLNYDIKQLPYFTNQKIFDS